MEQTSAAEVTFTTIANIFALTAVVVQEIAGNEISNQVNGETLTDASIYQLCAAELQAQLGSKGF